MTDLVLPPVQRREIAQLIEDRLRALPGVPAVAVFVGRVGQVPLLPSGPAERGADPVVGPYVVLHAGAGRRDVDGDRDVGDRHEDLSVTVQITCAAGTPQDCERLLDRVDAWLHRWTPVPAGPIEDLAFGLMRPPPGYDPGLVRHDVSVSPSRWWAPLQYRLDATAT